VILAACPRSITDNGYVLTVTPVAANVFVDDSLRFSATLVDHTGAVVSTAISWSVDNPAVASVDTAGMVHGHASGSATISVSAKGQTASASIVVVVDSGQTLSVAPNAANLSVSRLLQFTATLKDRNGKPLPSSVHWESNNTAVATVDANGLVRGVSTGTATIQAKVHDLVAAAPVTVAPMPASVVLVGAGDIASCTLSDDEATAKLLDAIDGAVFTVGDNAYENGSATDFSRCYGPTWGRHKSRTRPAIGNHEYNTIGAAGYFDYFGAAAGDGTTGYYSYDLGPWHIIVLNSNVAMNAGSLEETWLRSDLAAHPVRCTLAIWHHPRFSSGQHGSAPASQPLWQALYDADADLVVVGHDHLYERFKPQTATGQVDLARGIREFVVGTGGGDLYAFVHPALNSEVKNNVTHGVLKLTLYGDRYDWKFVPVAGSSFTDSGTANCH
jgi:hypothetical protein